MFPVAVAAASGWLLLFFVVLALPPASQPSRDEDATPGTEPPAVVSLLAGRLQQDGFVVTLADLATRGWFQLSGVPGPAGPVVCPGDVSGWRPSPRWGRTWSGPVLI